MATTALVCDERFGLHDTGSGHPERAERLQALRSLFSGPTWAALPRVDGRLAEERELLRVHSPDHLATVARSADHPRSRFDPDTTACDRSFEAARLAAGAAIDLADGVMDRAFDNGFAALRPPGHHAERDRAMGFCLFNNAAVVARHLLEVRRLSRVLVVDWDVHHGNGTQHLFYDVDSVMYASMHQYPFYPGSGASEETGRSAGEGCTVNLPMAAASTGHDYRAAIREVLIPIATAFEPEFVLVSAGFDAHRDDPLAAIDLDEKDFAFMTARLRELAETYAGGRMVLLLEGGYDLAALVASVDAVLGVLGSDGSYDDGREGGELAPWSRATLDLLRTRWGL
ncbi:MAG: histone deacetylase [Candidatus Binatia bacterium]